MPLDDLLASLEREARTEADRLLAEARAEAASRIAESEASLAREQGSALDAHVRDRNEELETVLSAARMAARREVLEIRSQLLGRILSALTRACPRATLEPAFLATLPHRLHRARACHAGDVALVLSTGAPLIAEVTRLAAELPLLTVREDDACGTGIHLATTDGKVEVIDTLEARVAAHRDPLGRRAMAALDLGP